MSWRDNLRKASFRGVEFHVNSAAESGGRRVVTHNMPLQDDVIHEDLGLKETTFTLEAFVLGQNYFTQRDALLAAVKKSGAGQLIHPFKGSLNVVCKSYKMNENFRQGGMATFSLSFEKTTDKKQPVAVVDTQLVLSKAKDSAIKSAAKDFVDDFDVNNMPMHVVESALSSALKATDLLDMQNVVQESPQKALLNLASDTLRTDLGKIINDSKTLADRLLKIVDLLDSDNSASFAPFSGFVVDSSEYTHKTASNIRKNNNNVALAQFIKRVGVSNEVYAIALKSFPNYEESVSERLEVSDKLDSLIVDAADSDHHETYIALSDLKVSFVRSMDESSSKLPRVSKIKQSATMPALAIANRIYGADKSKVLSMSEDIAQRNKEKHSGFITGGELEVLANA